MSAKGFDFTIPAASGFEGQIQLIEETWGVTLDAPRPEARIRQRLEAFNEWADSVPRPDFAAIFLHAPADEWDTLVQAELKKEEHWRVVAEVSDLGQELGRQQRALFTNGAAFDWILDQLDIQKMTALFMKSVKELGNVRDLDTALDTKPKAALELRKSGRALAALSAIAPTSAGLGDPRQRQRFFELRTCAALARPTREFDPLIRHRYSSGWVHTEDTWEPAEYDAQLEAAAAAQPGNVSEFLVSLARGDIKHFELAPVTSLNELRQRQHALHALGTIVEVDKGFGRAITAEDRKEARSQKIAAANKVKAQRPLDPDA
ncbi:hypothetical protein JKI95_09235 [Corynebacterium aquatimens]|uniref:Uncharacterized protein n=1 Tax=Corynebacterium stercoris TaxID=2943490 RepID=A0ABT1FYV1_9CORY|nr:MULTISPECIES: hypothetical protein [Corynebacterium]MCP1386940.1 hypothetical protein [Corynebacterium stercoris]QYH19318.1 hypothetical protein JKI95_09235 [Corynebacterium aquatimens]UIZ91787.1 hypothetical protein JZY91_08665 [Corynebacterium sp. CNCTC7651]